MSKVSEFCPENVQNLNVSASFKSSIPAMRIKIILTTETRKQRCTVLGVENALR